VCDHLPEPGGADPRPNDLARCYCIAERQEDDVDAHQILHGGEPGLDCPAGVIRCLHQQSVYAIRSQAEFPSRIHLPGNADMAVDEPRKERRSLEIEALRALPGFVEQGLGLNRDDAIVIDKDIESRKGPGSGAVDDCATCQSKHISRSPRTPSSHSTGLDPSTVRSTPRRGLRVSTTLYWSLGPVI